MTAGKNFTLWPFQINRPAKKSDHTRKRSLKLEALEERQLLAVTPWEYASHMQDAYEDVSSYGPLDDMEDHWTEEDEAAAEAERLQLTAAALRERLRGYGVSSMVSRQVYGPETLEQYRAVTFGLGVRNAGLDNPSLLNNGEFDNAYEVDTLWDVIDPTDGVTSLREAIISANTFAGYDLITFASGLSGTIYLSGTALPTITEGLNIRGPGDDVLTIDAGDLSRIFVIVGTDPNDPTPDVPTGLSGASSATGDSVTLSWTASADANMYAVYRRVYGVQGDSWGQWSYLDETTETNYTDSTVNPETTYQYYLIAANDTTGKMSSPSNTVTVTTNPNLWIDLDIDSDNYTNGNPAFGLYHAPERSEREEYYEAHDYALGKIMIPNWGDSDGDGILDCWDGYHIGSYDQTALGNGVRSELFYPIVLEIPEDIDISEVKFQIDYWMASTTPTNGTNNPPLYGDGSIRIWKKNGTEARNANGLFLNGDLVMPLSGDQYYTAAQLGFTNEIRTITLYVEAVKENTVQYHEEDDWKNVYGNEKPTSSIIVSMEYGNYTVFDEVRYVVSHNDPDKSETSCFWYNVLAHEEFRQAFASAAIYERADLPQFGMQLLGMSELAEMGITTQARLLLARSYPGDFFAFWDKPDDPQGFNAGIYYDHITGKAVLTFQGTNAGELADWQANFAQGIGLATDQYNAAMTIGESLLSLFGSGTNYSPLSVSTPSKPTDIMITGHSLGGGLASAATIVTGFATNTFNAAGLADMTIATAHGMRLDVGYLMLQQPEFLVTPYITENDWLNTLLYPLGLQAFGFNHRYILQDEQWVVGELEAHSMIQVHYGLMYMYIYNIPQSQN